MIRGSLVSAARHFADNFSVGRPANRRPFLLVRVVADCFQRESTHEPLAHVTVGDRSPEPDDLATVDKNPAYPVAFEAVRHEGLVRPRSNLRQCKYLNNIIEQDHRFIKRRTRPMLGFKRFTTAWRTLRGIEIMHALRKGQARWMAKGDVVGQTQLIHKVFGLAA